MQLESSTHPEALKLNPQNLNSSQKLDAQHPADKRPRDVRVSHRGS